VAAQELNIGVGVGDNHTRGGVVVREREDRRDVVVRPGYRDYNRSRVVVRRAPACRMVVVRNQRPNGTVVIRRIRECR
jgi:hypothetical protein